MSETESVFAMMRRLDAMADGEYLEYLVAYQAAATVGGVKPATLVCPSGGGRDYPAAWRASRRRIARTLGVALTALRVASGSLMLLAYRPCLLRKALGDAEAGRLLESAGYDVSSRTLAPLLARLRDNFRNGPFPHEIGVFLGYPPRDVDCFMKYGGRYALAAGCWKIYGDVEAARRRSRRCLEAKVRAAALIGSGAAFEEVAARLREGMRPATA